MAGGLGTPNSNNRKQDTLSNRDKLPLSGVTRREDIYIAKLLLDHLTIELLQNLLIQTDNLY